VSRQYPVHCAAEGGSLELLQWLVEDLGCPLYNAQEQPLVTHQGDSVLAVAARHGHCHVMRWLVLSKECKVRDGRQMLQTLCDQGWEPTLETDN
jgi:hypothetical protein